MPLSTGQNPAKVPLTDVSDEERKHPITVFSHDTEFTKLDTLVRAREQRPRTFTATDQELRNLVPAYAAIRASGRDDQHPLTTAGLQEALAYAAQHGEASIVLASLPCEPPPARDIFPLDASAPGPSAFMMRARKAIVEGSSPEGVFFNFHELNSPCLGPVSRARQARCGLSQPTEPPPKRWRDVGGLFVRLYMTCLRAHGIKPIAHFVSGRWLALALGITPIDEALNLHELVYTPLENPVATYLSYHPRVYLTSPHIVVRSLSIARECAQLAHVHLGIGAPLIDLATLYGAYTWYLESRPPQRLARPLTFLPWPSVALGVGITPIMPVDAQFNLLTTALADYFDVFGIIHVPSGPAVFICDGLREGLLAPEGPLKQEGQPARKGPTARDGPLTMRVVRMAIRKAGQEEAGLTNSEAWRAFSTLFGGVGRRSFLVDNGVPNVEEMSIEEVNQTWGLETRRFMLVAKAGKLEAVGWDRDKVYAESTKWIRRQHLSKNGAVDVETMTDKQVQIKHMFDFKSKHLAADNGMARNDVSWSEKEVGLLWFVRNTRKVLRKDGIAEDVIEGMSVAELKTAWVLRTKQKALIAAGHDISQSSRAEIPSLFARKFRYFEHFRDPSFLEETDGEVDGLVTTAEPDAAATAAKIARGRARRHRTAMRKSTKRRLETTTEYFGNAVELFGEARVDLSVKSRTAKPKKDLVSRDSAVPHATTSIQDRKKRLNEALRAVVEATEGAAWPKPLSRWAKGEMIPTFGQWFSEEKLSLPGREWTKQLDLSRFLRACGITGHHLSTMHGSPELRDDFAQRYQQSARLRSDGWNVDDCLKLSLVEVRWICLAITSGFIEYTVSPDGPLEHYVDYHPNPSNSDPGPSNSDPGPSNFAPRSTPERTSDRSDGKETKWDDEEDATESDDETESDEIESDADEDDIESGADDDKDSQNENISSDEDDAYAGFRVTPRQSFALVPFKAEVDEPTAAEKALAAELFPEE